MNLARSLGSVGGLTLASRVLGLARDMLFAQFVGANFASDAFAVAWRMPNMFRALFAEGAFSAAFIPMFNKKVANPDGAGLPAGIEFAEDALSVLLPALLLMTVLLGIGGALVGGIVASAIGEGDIFELNFIGTVVGVIAAVGGRG